VRIEKKAMMTYFEVLFSNFSKKPENISTSSSDYISLINTNSRGTEVARKIFDPATFTIMLFRVTQLL
jgi:hypothetical protein